jgi:hypothetical protein
MKTLANQWAYYADKVIPTTAGAAQRSAMRQAFYAGAAAAFQRYLEAGDDSISDGQAKDMMDNLREELLAYAQSQQPKPH